VTELLFPVGHYLGAHYRGAAGQPTGHRVRLGPSLRWLGTESELLAWTFAHGLGESADQDQPWDRTTMIEYAHWLTGTDLTEAVTGLVARKLLVEVDPDDGVGADGFARSYQLRALMLALGRDPDEPDSVLLGVAGEPAVALSEFGHAVWQTSQRSPSLWDTCQAVAGSDPASADPEPLLPELLGELHGLLGAGVAYLDAAEGESHAGVEIH
jgi:hypothetical protein